VERCLLERMSIYLAKMSVHHMDLASLKPSFLAIGSIYVSLEICGTLIKKSLMNEKIVKKMLEVSHMTED
jgi:hypothetical protein